MSPHHPQDEGFHEIQLNGKQLVFLFMAATVVSVVIFLCGVLVGRGVRVERGLPADIAELTTVAAADTPGAPASGAPAPVAAGSDPTAAAPPPTVDDLSYFNRLEKPNAPAEVLKAAPDVAKDAPKPAVTPATPAQPAPEPSKGSQIAAAAPAPPAAGQDAAARSGAAAAGSPATAASSAAPPPTAASPAAAEGAGYALQVAALKERDDAEAIAKRLAQKGYAAYVLMPATGAPSVYRVRVGKFRTKREAESIAAKLQKEEQFNPWITR